MIKRMVNQPDLPPLKSLHPDSSLIPAKLGAMEQYSTDMLKESLLPGRRDCLKTRTDGTILDGHHRIYLLRMRGVDVDSLPREIIDKEDPDTDVDQTPLG